MKRTFPALKIAVLAVYVLVNVWPLTALGQSEEYKRLDAMEKSVAAAYDGVDFELHEKLLKDLREEYKRLKRKQEEIWLLYANDMDKKALEMEKNFRMHMQTEDIVPGSIQRMQGGEVFKARLTSGYWVVLRMRIPQARAPEVEAMIYELDKLLNFHLVPIVGYKTVNGEFASVQPFIAELQLGQQDFRKDPYQDERLHILDFLTQQMDRHQENWATAPGGHLIALDNDIVNGLPAWDHLRQSGRQVSADTPPKSISAKNRKALEKAKRDLDHPDIRVKFQPAFRQRVLDRIDLLLKLTAPKACGDELKA